MMTVKAFENTWINSRRKRRMEKKKETETSNNPETSHESEEKKSNDNTSCKLEENNETDKTEEDTTKPSNGNDQQLLLSEKTNQENDCAPGISGQKRKNSEELIEQNSKHQKLEEYLVASLMLKDSDELNVITLELYFIEGTGGKDAANQLLTFVKNRLK